MLSIALAYIILAMLVGTGTLFLGASVRYLVERHGPDWEGVVTSLLLSIVLFGTAFMISVGAGL